MKLLRKLLPFIFTTEVKHIVADLENTFNALRAKADELLDKAITHDADASVAKSKADAARADALNANTIASNISTLLAK